MGLVTGIKHIICVAGVLGWEKIGEALPTSVRGLVRMANWNRFQASVFKGRPGRSVFKSLRMSAKGTHLGEILGNGKQKYFMVRYSVFASGRSPEAKCRST